MVTFQEFYKDRAKSYRRIENLILPKEEGNYSLIAVHVTDVTRHINDNISRILDGLSGSSDNIILVEWPGHTHDFLKSANLPIDVYRYDIPNNLNGSRYILTGWDLKVCLKEHYNEMLSIKNNRLIEVNIPLGAAEYSLLEWQGKTKASYNLLLYVAVESYHKNAQRLRGSSALSFDGELIDATGKELSTLVNFYSSTEKFLMLC